MRVNAIGFVLIRYLLTLSATKQDKECFYEE